MTIIPAIDIRRKKVVRLYKGQYHKETVYAQSPKDTARQWLEQGAKILHIVDLDGAFRGKTKILPLIEEIIKENKDARIHLGGGIRTTTDIENALKIGVNKVILSTKVFEDESFITTIPQQDLNKIIVSIDSKNGIVQDKGWTRQTNISAVDAIKKVEEMGIGLVVVTDISTDGTLTGPNLPFLEKALKTTKIQIIASGGISSIEDIKALKSLGSFNLFGIIIGKALYENKINLKEALKYA